MKVIHVPFCFYPDPVGGTEVYVALVATQLQAQGIETRHVAGAVAGRKRHELFKSVVKTVPNTLRGS